MLVLLNFFFFFFLGGGGFCFQYMYHYRKLKKHTCRFNLLDFRNCFWIPNCNKNIGLDYSDVIMRAMVSKSQASRLFAQPFRRRSKKTSKLRVTGLCEGNPFVTGGSPHKGPVTRQIFPFDDVIMCKGRPINNGNNTIQ